MRLGVEDAVPQKVPQHGDLVQDVNAQRRARQPVDEPVAAKVQIFEEVEQRQRRQQAGSAPSRRAVVGNVLERLAVGRRPGIPARRGMAVLASGRPRPRTSAAAGRFSRRDRRLSGQRRR